MESPITTYNTLVQALVTASENSSAEFLEYTPVAIDLAETRLIREVYKEGVAQDVDILVPQGVNTIPKPASFRLMRSLTSVVGTRVETVQKKPRSFIYEYHPDSLVEGTPKYYADLNNDEFIIAPAPDTDTTFRVQFVGRASKLSSGNQTNFFTEKCADMLFYASMREMMVFDKNTEQEAVFENLYQNARSGMIEEAKRERGDDENHQTVIDTSVNQ